VSVDLERLQADVTDKLNSEELFQYVAVSSFRRLVIAFRDQREPGDVDGEEWKEWHGRAGADANGAVR
jgi:hypothetical protein